MREEKICCMRSDEEGRFEDVPCPTPSLTAIESEHYTNSRSITSHKSETPFIYQQNASASTNLPKISPAIPLLPSLTQRPQPPPSTPRLQPPPANS